MKVKQHTQTKLADAISSHRGRDDEEASCTPLVNLGENSSVYVFPICIYGK